MYTLAEVGHELLHDMLADFPPEQAADETEFLARLGQFSLLDSAERAAVLAARTRAVREQLAHLDAMRDLATVHGERWGALVTAELIRRHSRELTWLAELAGLAAQPDPRARARSRARAVTARAELTHPEDAGPAGPRPPRLGSLVQYALLAGPLLSMLDSSIVNVAVEPIARELHASLTTVQWTGRYLPPAALAALALPASPNIALSPD